MSELVKFVKISTPDAVARYLADALRSRLDSGQPVLWLVPGGSSIKIAAAVSTLLAGSDLSRLTVTLTDERFGPVGHPDSNWLQLQDAGFKLPGAKMIPVLMGADMADTVTSYAEILQSGLERDQYRIGFFGIGPDGHTAGILPGSPAVGAIEFAAGYDAGNFKRLTMTFPAIRLLDEAVVYAVGEAKWPVIEQLADDVELAKQPAQALKTATKLTIFNDHKGDGQ